MAERRLAALRRHHHARELRELRQDARGRAHELLRPVGGQLAFEPVDLALLERLDDHQAVDEEAVALRRGHAAGGRVRARDEAHLLQVGHHVADRRRRQVEPRMPRQRARADRLAVADVAFDQRLEEVLRARIQHGRDSTAARARRGAAHRNAAGALVRMDEVRPARACGLIGPCPRRRRPPPSPASPSSAATRAPASRRRSPRLAAFLAARGHEVVVDAETAAYAPVPGYRTAPTDELARQADLAIVVGGDGTMLVDRAPAGAVRRAADRHQPGAPGLPDRHSARAHGGARSTRCSPAATSRSAARCSRWRCAREGERRQPRSR